MSENISQLENLTSQFELIDSHYNNHLNEPDNDGHIINLIISIFDYIGYHVVSEKGFEIITMDWKANNILFNNTEDEIIKGQCTFRTALFLTISYQVFTLFIGMAQTAEQVSEEMLNKNYQPDDPHKKIVDMIKLLYEVKKYTNVDFPNLYEKICGLVITTEQILTPLLKTFNFESAMKYNQEKRRIFKDAIFGQLHMEIPDEDIDDIKAKATPVDI
jgi:hypothetical protein